MKIECTVSELKELIDKKDITQNILDGLKESIKNMERQATIPYRS